MGNNKNIAVDIGNSRIKTALFEGSVLETVSYWEHLQALRKAYRKEKAQWIFSSVGEQISKIQELFEGEDYLILDSQTPLPVTLDYETPHTLGSDRIAAAVGARELYPGKDLLIVDVGTCIKYDLLSKHAVFLGGVIAPGLKMRMRALHEFTLQLPDISDDWEKITNRVPGKTTRECLYQGTFNAISHEMNGFIRHFRKEYDNLHVILTGGDAVHFESRLKAPIFANFNLVVIGLNRILIYTNETR